MVRRMSGPPPAAPRAVAATRYVTPLREGGSLPALVEADDDGLYVVKFRGAGQGPLALVAEMIVGGLARLLDLAVPEVVVVDLPQGLAGAEPDQEIQDLLRASVGANVGLDFLPGALAFDPASAAQVDPDRAAEIVWLDALTTNVDRSARNPNLLLWHGRVWAIDHGAALYRHHVGWPIAPDAGKAFPAIAEHVLLPFAGSIEAADGRLAHRVGGAALAGIVAGVPDGWLAPAPGPVDRRADYVEYLSSRLASRGFVAEAERARTA